MVGYKVNAEPLTLQEVTQLEELQLKIIADFQCATSPTGFLPCIKCRIDAVEQMKKYLELNGYTVTNP